VTQFRPPTMRRTRWADLAGIVVVFGVLGWLFGHGVYASLPPLSPVTPVPIAALALLELVVARRVRAAVRHEPSARPMQAIAVARCVALGKASSLVAAGVLGAALGLLVEVLPDIGTVRAVGHDVVVLVVLAAVAALLLAAGLLLERAGVDPGQDSRRPMQRDANRGPFGGRSRS